MQVKDAFAIYDFFGQLDYVGGIVLGLLLALVACYFAIIVIVKLSSSSRLRYIVVLAAGLLVLLSVIGITLVAHKRYGRVTEANALKSYLKTQNWKLLSFHRIANEVSLSSADTALAYDSVGRIGLYHQSLQKRQEKIKTLTDEFPDEFIIGKMTDPDLIERQGIRLVDTAAVNSIENYNKAMLPFFSSKIRYYMDSIRKMKCISYQEIEDSLDGRCDSELLDLLIASSKDVFVSVNIRRTDGNPGWIEGIKLIK
jgi:hypothetical protein